MIEKRNLYYSQDYDVPFRHPKKLHARAIYDNMAESPEELAFKKGDILSVVEQDPDGMTGWWLCILRGRQGLCPGNRLRIMNSYDSGCFTPSPTSSPSPSLGASTASVASSDIYDTTSSHRQGKRRSWYITPHKVVTPQKCGDVYLYDVSPSSRSSPYQNLSSMSDPEAYDIPRPSTQINYDCPKNWSKTPVKDSIQMDDSYDTPRSINSLSQQNMTPSSSNSSLMTPDNLSLSSSNRSSLANMPDYDIPRRNAPSIRSITPQSISNHHHHQQHPAQSTYDFPQQIIQQHHHNNKEKPQPLVNKELPLELSSALEALAKLQNEATFAVTKLLAFVVPNWRMREKLEPVLMDIKLAAVRLRTALHDLAEFGEGALGNASRSEDKSLAHKLRPLVKALRDADKLVHEASQNLDVLGWTIENLSRKDQKLSSGTHPPDSLDQLIACAQTLTEDVRQSASFIQGNATLLFKRVPLTPTAENNNGNWVEDNDYVSLESKDVTAKKNSELREAIPQNLKKKFDNAIKAAEDSAINSVKMELNSNDKLLINYYAAQISTHMGYLTQAIDSFLETVEKNQPPKFFIAYGKFVVLSAHNLVSIGDIVHRNLSRDDIKLRVQKFTDGLSDALKTCVLKSKKAAQHFPSVGAVQEMVDSVVDISHLASDLKIAMLQAVQV